MKAWLAFKHTTDIHILRNRGIILRNVLGTQSYVVISDDQSTKHRVTLFLYVVSSPIAPPISIGVNVNEL